MRFPPLRGRLCRITHKRRHKHVCFWTAGGLGTRNTEHLQRENYCWRLPWRYPHLRHTQRKPRRPGHSGSVLTVAPTWPERLLHVCSVPAAKEKLSKQTGHLLLNQEPTQRLSRKRSANLPSSGPNRNSTHRIPAWWFSFSRLGEFSLQTNWCGSCRLQLQTKVGRKSRRLCFIQMLTLSMLICRHAHFKQYLTFLKTSSDLK